MAVSALWAVDEAHSDAEPLFQHSSVSEDTDGRVKLDYFGDSVQGQVSIDKVFNASSPASHVYSSLEEQLLGVLKGTQATSFVRLGIRPPQLPLGVLFGETPLFENEDEMTSIRPTDGIALRVIKKLFNEMQVLVRSGKDAFSVRMGFSCFMTTPTKATDLLKNIKQQVPAELEWGDVEGVMPGRYIYVTSAADVVRTLSKLLASPSLKPVIHRLSYCLHFLVLKTPAGVPPAEASTAQVAHLVFADVNPDHTQAAQRALAGPLAKLSRDVSNAAMQTPTKQFNGIPLSPRGSAPLSPGRDSDGVFGKCFGLLQSLPIARLVILAAATRNGPLTSQQQVQMDQMMSLLQSAQKAGPVPVVSNSLPVVSNSVSFDLSEPFVMSTPRQVTRSASAIGVVGQALSVSPPRYSPPTSTERILTARGGGLQSPPRPSSPAPPLPNTITETDAILASLQQQALIKSLDEQELQPAFKPSEKLPSKSDLLLKDCRIHELENLVSQLEIRLIHYNGGETGEADGGWASRAAAETAKREVEILQQEIHHNGLRHEQELEAWRDRHAQLEIGCSTRIKELQQLLQDDHSGSDRHILQTRILELETRTVRAEQSREDSLMKSRALTATSEDMKTQVAGLRATVMELEVKLQNEALARDAADKDVDRLTVLQQSLTEKLSALKRSNSEAELEIRVTRSEIDALRAQLTDVSLDYESEKAISRRLYLLLESLGGVERDRVEEREKADRARVWSDFVEGLHWLAHTCMRWTTLRGGNLLMSGTHDSSPLQHIDDVQTLRDRLSQRDSQLYAKTSEAMQLEQQLIDIQDKFREKDRSDERSISLLEEKNRLLFSEVRELERQRETNGDEVRRLASVAQNSESDRYESADVLRRLRAEHAAMKETVEEVTRQRTVAINEAELLRRKQSQTETKTDKGVMRLTAELKQREVQVNDMRQQLAAFHASQDAHISSERNSRKLQLTISELEAKLRKAEVIGEQQKLRVSELERHVESERNIAQQNEAMAMHLRAEGERREREFGAFSTELERLEVEKRTQETWVGSFQHEIREKTLTLDNIEKLLREEQSKQLTKEEEIASLQRQLAISKEEINSLQRQIGSTRRSRTLDVSSPTSDRKNKMLRDQLATIEKENGKLRRLREEELKKAGRPAPAVAPPPGSLPPPAIARAELQLAQMKTDLAAMPPLPLPSPSFVAPVSRNSIPHTAVATTHINPTHIRSVQPLMSPRTVTASPPAAVSRSPSRMLY